MFLVGIDLGTTNSAVAYVDTRKRDARVEMFAIPQLVGPHEVAERVLLPSFLYFGEPQEIESGSLALPWNSRPDAVAGYLARNRGMLSPSRQVSSAKSWLACSEADRTAAILPWTADVRDRRISPVAAASRYLSHIRDAWNHVMAHGQERLRLERQPIVLTVPASFDEEARELTVDAAHLAGFERLTLLEEPLAAFYAWLSSAQAGRGGWPSAGGLALVCDVGGGTTDLTLVAVKDDFGKRRFDRVAVGEHLLLGGDNLDLALASIVERKLVARGAPPLALPERYSVRLQASAAKERLLAEGGTSSETITLLGRGRRLVGGTTAVELTRDEALEILLEGFLPIHPPDAQSQPPARATGLRELGLPYEPDPAITRHVLAFLHRAAGVDGVPVGRVAAPSGPMAARPETVLFNGGFFAPPLARERMIDALEAWFGSRPQALAGGPDLANAVAIGAAWYACLRSGTAPSAAVRVRAGSSRAYYIGLGDERRGEGTRAVALLPRGADEGTSLSLPHDFTVRTNVPVSFTLYSSAVLSDPPGSVVSLPSDGRLRRHAPLVTVLRYGKKSRSVDLEVRLAVRFTEVGTLELWCESKTTDHKWRLQFELRREHPGGEAELGEETGPREDQAIVPEEAIEAGEEAVRATFEAAAPARRAGQSVSRAEARSEARPGAAVTPETLMSALEAAFGFGKTAWPASLIRRLADFMIELEGRRRLSPRHEARWLNLFGFCMRPGFGASKDPWRIGEARKVYASGLAFPSDTQCRVEWTLMWQRLAGGLSSAQQRELAARAMAELGIAGKKTGRLAPQVERETWRLLANLERIEAASRERIGEALLARLRRDPRNSSLAWAMGRLGARTPLYGPLTAVVPPETAGRWLIELSGMKSITGELAAAMVQAASLTGDVLRDVEGPVREAVLRRLSESGFEPNTLRPLSEVVPVTASETNRIFGEMLPEGLQLRTGQT
ncbi:MAG: Hsp70 family protein [Vicinamibacterales bacterium]